MINLDDLRKNATTYNFDKQHNLGKMTARERIDELLDDGTFQEIGLFVKHRCYDFDMINKNIPNDGVITGIGKVDGKDVVIVSQDFLNMGGTLGEMHAKKIIKAQEIALYAKCPIVFINDSGGARIQEGVASLAGYGEIFFNNVKMSGLIPQIAVIAGPCAGGAVYSPALMDFIFFIDGIGKMFVTGPEVVRTVTFENVSQEQLGGSYVHCNISGVANFLEKDEHTCFNDIRKLLSYLYANEHPKARISKKYTDECLHKIETVVPLNKSKTYDVRELISLVVDESSFFEYSKKYARNIVVGFAFLNGHSVGIVANQPNCLAGCLDIDASDKAARFVRTCNVFNIPLITVVDVPGYLPGLNQEENGIIRHGAKLIYAYAEATVPKLTLITRKAYGGAYIAMCSKHLGATEVFAWPFAEISVMGVDGAKKILSKNLTDKKNHFNDIDSELQNISSVLFSANRGYVDEIIAPNETRSRLINTLELLLRSKKTRTAQQCGNIPL